MGMKSPQQYIAKVADKYFVSDNQRFLYVKFELVNPDRISFQAGQYVSVKINEAGERRSYSIVSTSDEDHGFHILAEMVNGGKGSEFLKQIKPGQEVEVLGPMGRFVVQENQNTKESENQSKLLFVATGSGIVPIYSMINDRLINKHETRQMRLHWGMRSEGDLFFVDNLERLAEEHPNFVFDIVLSKPSEQWDLCSGHVQDCLQRDFTGGMDGWEAYVCGSPEKVGEICAKLVELGIEKDKIYSEKFT